MLSDVEIARQAKPVPIAEIAHKLGYTDDDIELYGKYKAKVPVSTKRAKRNSFSSLL